MADFSFSVKNHVGILTFDAQDAKVNILSEKALREFAGHLDRIRQDKSLKALFLTSAKKKIFIAGADIKEIQSISNAAEGEKKSLAGHMILSELEDLPIPSVALINGACLGGGLELALACTYRFAGHSEDVKIGLPEVKLGIFPGFGGTFRLPRRTGLQKGIELIVQAKILDGGRALSACVVDGLAADSLLFDTALEFLQKINFQKGKNRIPRQTTAGKLLEETAPGRALIRKSARKAILDLTRGNYPAPLKALDVILDNWRAPRQEAIDREAREFGKIVADGSYKNLIHVFYLTERYKKEKWTDAPPRPVAQCGVLGAGIMGGGIAQLTSSESLQTRLKDVNPESILLGLRSARKVYVKAVQRRKLLKAEAETRLGYILPTLDYSGFDRCDFVIEAVVENLEVKKKVFAELAAVTRPDAILASNTSSLPVSRMADAVKNPERVGGMHFFNPVDKMPLVEVIRAEKTSEETIASIVEFSRRLKKTPVVVKDSPGFLVNRLLMPYLNEAGFLFEEGESPDRVDRVLLDFGMPMGAFWLLDEIGLDVADKVGHVLHDAFGDRMKPCATLGQMAQKKWLGKKTGRGFFIHEKDKRRLNPELAIPLSKGPRTDEEIVRRCLSVMINEAARCLEDGVVRSAPDVDIAMILGAGFPPFRGGLLHYADALGTSAVLDHLESFRARTASKRFEPAKRLIEMKKSGAKFYA